VQQVAWADDIGRLCLSQSASFIAQPTHLLLLLLKDKKRSAQRREELFNQKIQNIRRNIFGFVYGPTITSPHAKHYKRHAPLIYMNFLYTWYKVGTI
jgi:hypothetical protein